MDIIKMKDEGYDEMSERNKNEVFNSRASESKGRSTYEMTEEQYNEIQDAMYSISNLIEIMNGYCENNFENVKEMGPLLTLISQIKAEERRVTGLF